MLRKHPKVNDRGVPFSSPWWLVAFTLLALALFRPTNIAELIGISLVAVILGWYLILPEGRREIRRLIGREPRHMRYYFDSRRRSKSDE
jgi:hypothetical protein